MTHDVHIGRKGPKDLMGSRSMGPSMRQWCADRLYGPKRLATYHGIGNYSSIKTNDIESSTPLTLGSAQDVDELKNVCARFQYLVKSVMESNPDSVADRHAEDYSRLCKECGVARIADWHIDGGRYAATKADRCVDCGGTGTSGTGKMTPAWVNVASIEVINRTLPESWDELPTEEMVGMILFGVDTEIQEL
ncbi:hypothetical protein BGX26_005940 [Mortierella sp. AD094]|nr:hypothetical protein BGX26_005940 [Mortierella sp. AD094]